jgi:hypothetical protein
MARPQTTEASPSEPCRSSFCGIAAGRLQTVLIAPFICSTTSGVISSSG